MYKKASCRTRTAFSKCLKPFKKQESHEDKERANCCNQLLKKSSITGFLEIAKSERFLRKACKLFVFFICTAGFFYQTLAFLDIYLAYPTSQDVSEDYPEEFIAPAITICNNNRLLRVRLCKVAPGNCTWENTTTVQEFCETHKRRCNFVNNVHFPKGGWDKIEDFVFSTPLFDGKFKSDNSNRLLNLTGPQNEKEIIYYCSLWINEVFVKCNSSIMIQAAKNGFPYKCFSLFSLLGKPNEDFLKLSVSDVYTIIFDLHPEEYINDRDLVQAWVIFHDPRKLVNPMTEGVPLTGRKHYNLFLTMEQKVSLPPPYASKCEDYLNKWKENGGYGPLSKKDCIDLCIIEAMVVKYNCVGQQITYPNDYEICPYEDTDATTEMMRTCQSSCSEGCEETTYSFTSRNIVDVGSACYPEDEACIVMPFKNTTNYFLYRTYYIGILLSFLACVLNANFKVTVRFTRMTVRKFQHIPRFESIELFSYMGGYLGMWLGISLASLFDLGEIIFDTVYPLLKGRKNQKTTTPIEKFRHQTV